MRSLPLLAAAALLLAGCANPRVTANVAEQMLQAGNAISALQQDQGSIESELDSLRLVVAHQDTLLARIAQQINLPMAQH
jgi:peptidoglycan hydrolase CwlO-like protein